MSWRLRLDASPPGWERTQLRAVLTRTRDRGSPQSPLLSVNLQEGVVLRAEGDGRPAPSQDLSAYQVVRRGDLVMNQLGKPHGALGVSPHDGIISPAYFVARISDCAEPRFLHYLLRTRLYISEYERRGKHMPPSQFDISWEQFRSIPVALPPLTIQRAIVDFVDSAVSRIDEIIAKKRRLLELLEERFWTGVVATVNGATLEMAPLRRFILSIKDGPFGSSLTSSHYSEDGARVVRLGNIGLADFRDADQAFIPLPHYEDLKNHGVHPRNLLIAGLGDSKNHVGRACVAPDLGPAIVKADCYCAQVNDLRATPEFLALFLSSPIGAGQVALAARGTTRSRINLDIAKEIRVPLLDVDAQKRIASDAERKRRVVACGRDRLLAQVDRLVEHRQAFITAAVSGAVPIPGCVA